MIGIYKITNPKGKVYVGQSVDIEARFRYYRGNHFKGQVLIYRSIMKYGIDLHKFVVLEECEVSELNLKERYWQEYYNVLEDGLNCILTKVGDKSGKLSEVMKKKISEANRGRKLSEDHKDKISKAHKGVPRSQEVIESLRKANIGRKRSQDSINKGLETKGKFQHTEESKTRMSKQKKGSVHTEEAKKKMSEAKKGVAYSEERCRSISERQLGKKRGPYKK